MSSSASSPWSGYSAIPTAPRASTCNARELDRAIERIDDAPRDVRRMRRIGIAEQHDELVLADARERVLATAGDGGHTPGDLGHQPVTRRMPKRVADLVEMPDMHRQ